ncbi:hypothetical protein [Acrocarpospora pleiomorpha]|uniref:hypothetical protein n=1 Tax=Acrocarpospora pleiomorpha TaxID=90975 RepID=UPI0012D31250|nr:hypothetical protein [Acrocarpospora pleiomorpha]
MTSGVAVATALFALPLLYTIPRGRMVGPPPSLAAVRPGRPDISAFRRLRVTTGGTGIGNLSARVQALGGHFTAGPHGEGGFELVVEIPGDPAES